MTIFPTTREIFIPTILITSSSKTVTYVNPQNKLILSGKVITKVACVYQWTSFSNATFVINHAVGSPLSATLPKDSNTIIYLVINSYMLPARSSVLFTLSCEESSSSVLVTTNGPPLHGTFKALPNHGLELSTIFNFTAIDYIDSDLPLSYQFGFILDGIHNVLQTRSSLSIAFSSLAAGSVISYVQVYDAYGVSVESIESVLVKKQMDQKILEDSINNALLSSSGDSKATQTALVLASTVINQVSCEQAPLCIKLNRLDCSKVKDTCGSCMMGYIGDSGDSNTPCANVQIKTNRSTTVDKSGCSGDDDCPPFQLCNVISKLCVLPSRNCHNDCDGHGSCLYKNINTNQILKDCKVTDVYCQASCDCNRNYTGSDCSINRADMNRREALRNVVLTRLSSIVTSTTLTTENLGSLTVTLSSLSNNVYEVTPTMASTIGNIAFSVLSSATNSNQTVNYESLSGILNSVNTVLQVSTANTQSANILDLFSDLVSSQLTPGEKSIDYIYDSFRMTVLASSVQPGKSLRITAPQTLMEANFATKNSSSISIQQTQHSDSNSLVDVSVSMIVTKASSYDSQLAVKLNSNPVRVKLNSIAMRDTEIIFTLVHNIDIEFTNRSIAKQMSFNTSCNGSLDYSIHNYSCPYSHQIVVHRCEGRSGILTSYCKILAPICALIDSNKGILETNSSVCLVLEYSKSSTTCKCILQPQQSNRRLDNYAMDGALTLVSTSMYVASNFKDTFSSVGNMNSSNDIQRVLIVIIMFSILWTFGLLLIFGCLWRRTKMLKVNILDQKNMDKITDEGKKTFSKITVHQNLVNYVKQSFPSIFSDEPLARRIYSEICRHHRYLTLISSSKGEAGDKQRVITCIQLLSIQTMLMFLVALLYDVQGPSDDRSCSQQVMETDCLLRRSIFDQTQSYCSWISNSQNSGTFVCVYQQPKFTIKTVFVISVLVSLMTTLFSKPIDMIFDLLTAPTADELKKSNSEGNMLSSIGRRLSTTVRRVSTVASNSVSSVINKLSDTKNHIVFARKIPRNTMIAHQLASASMVTLASNSLQAIQERRLSMLRTYYTFNKNDEIDSDSSGDDSGHDTDTSIEQLRKASLVRKSMIEYSSSIENKNYVQSFTKASNSIENLSLEIMYQRKLLNSYELELFDQQWGIDPFGNFKIIEMRGLLRGNQNTREIISQQLTFVSEEVIKKSEKLKIADDGHIGLEILHLFIKDLLGRSTPAATIFEFKTNEDFKHTKVVSINSKRLAMLGLLGINIFFIYYSILTGFQRGISWQQSYLMACIIQFFGEIVFNETLECVWIQCFIPMLVSQDVRNVGDSILDIISELCSTKIESQEQKYLLNAPDFLFVSTNLAKKFPHLMESIVVQSYFTHLPGEISKLWNNKASCKIINSNVNSNIRRVTLLMTILNSIQYIGVVPFLVHRVFIRFMQPFAFGGILLMWSIIMTNLMYVAFMSISIAILIAYFVYKYMYGTAPNKNVNAIFPIVEEKNDDSDFDIVLSSDNSNDISDFDDIGSSFDDDNNDVDKLIDNNNDDSNFDIVLSSDDDDDDDDDDDGSNDDSDNDAIVSSFDDDNDDDDELNDNNDGDGADNYYNKHQQKDYDDSNFEVLVSSFDDSSHDELNINKDNFEYSKSNKNIDNNNDNNKNNSYNNSYDSDSSDDDDSYCSVLDDLDHSNDDDDGHDDYDGDDIDDDDDNYDGDDSDDNCDELDHTFLTHINDNVNNHDYNDINYKNNNIDDNNDNNNNNNNSNNHIRGEEATLFEIDFSINSESTSSCFNDSVMKLIYDDASDVENNIACLNYSNDKSNSFDSDSLLFNSDRN